MNEKLLLNEAWLYAVTIFVTPNGRFKALSPGGFHGYGRTKEDAIRDCAANAPDGYTFKFDFTGSQGYLKPTETKG